MVLDDDLLDRLDSKRFRVPMSAKVVGAWNLHAQTSLDLQLDMFVLYFVDGVSPRQSRSGWLRVVGQRLLRRAWLAIGERPRSAGAGYQLEKLPADAGFVARNPATARHLERTGMLGISAARALDVMGSLLGDDRACIGVAQLDWSAWEQAIPTLAARPRFAEVLAPRSKSGGRGETDSRLAVLLALRNASALDRIAMASGILGEIIAKVLRLPASKLDMEQNINQLGIDSLMAVELQTLIAERTGAHFSPMDFMAGMSIVTIASKLLERALARRRDRLSHRAFTEITVGSWFVVWN